MNVVQWTRMKTIVSLLLVAMLMFLAACGATAGKEGVNDRADGENSKQSSVVEPSKEPSPEPSKEAAADPVYPITVTDATGVQLTLEKAPAAIVTLVPSETETVYAIGAGEYVVGVDKWSNYPEEAASVARIGDMTTNIEAVAALNPDLILASSSMNAEAILKLRELNLNVYATNPKTYDEVIAKIEMLGTMLNKQAEANKVASHMREVKAQVTSAVKDAAKKKVYLEFSPGWTVGSGEFLDELLTLAGGINISAAHPGWYEVNAEEVITQNPELIIYPDYGEEKSPIVAGIEKRPGWDTIDAVKNNQMFAVANDPLVRVGPRLSDGLLELAQKIHPELVQ